MRENSREHGWRAAREERRQQRSLRTALIGTMVFALTLAGGVWGVVSWLNSRAEIPTISCTATLPDGTSHALSAEQSDNAALITAIALDRNLPARAATIALATAMQESKIRNIDYGDRDSVGLFQQRPSQGWGEVGQIMDPVYSTGAFYDALVKVDGYESMEITVAAQTVQRSAFPDAYAQHEGMARAFASALTGHSTASLTCDLGPSETAPAGTIGQRLERDFGAVSAASLGAAEHEIGSVAAGGTVVLIDTAAVLPRIETQRADWAIAQWAVATAWATGASTVAVGNSVWQRDGGTWQTLEVPLPAGSVTIG